MGKILTIEANSFCGKTSTGETLAKSMGVPFVAEYYFYKQGEFPDFPPRNFDDAIQQVDYFEKIELHRSQYAQELARKHHLVIMDRSFFSILALRYVGNYEKWRKFDLGYKYALQRAICIHKLGRIVCPDLLCLIDPSDRTFQKRVETRNKVSIDVFNQLRTKQIMHYNYFLPVVKKYGKDRLWLNPIEEDLDGTVTLLRRWIKRKIGMFSWVKKKTYFGI